jgi:hypothetical protein
LSVKAAEPKSDNDFLNVRPLYLLITMPTTYHSLYSCDPEKYIEKFVLPILVNIKTIPKKEGKEVSDLTLLAYDIR